MTRSSSNNSSMSSTIVIISSSISTTGSSITSRKSFSIRISMTCSVNSNYSIWNSVVEVDVVASNCIRSSGRNIRSGCCIRTTLILVLVAASILQVFPVRMLDLLVCYIMQGKTIIPSFYRNCKEEKKIS